MCSATEPRETTLILASGSPRRRELLPLLGVPFVVQPVEVSEDNHRGESPDAQVVRLAQLKAAAGLEAAPGRVIVAADTLVALDGRVLGKPRDSHEAEVMLRRLRGRSHTVFSGVTLVDGHSGWRRTELAQTTVWMRNYTDLELETYVSSGDPLDKAGAYAIQYPGFSPVERVEGCYANVIGLPLCHLYRLLQAMGYDLPQTPEAECFIRACCL